MLGKIIEIDGNTVFLELGVDDRTVQSLINLYVLITDNDRNYVAEINALKGKIAKLSLIGEFISNKFVYGVSNKPSFSARVNLIAPSYISKIIGVEDEQDINELALGNSVIYPDIRVGGKVNGYFR